MPAVGFLVWNEFQFFHVKSVLEQFPETILLIEARSGLRRRFPMVVTKGLSNRIEVIKSTDLARIDDLVDVVVVQSNTDAKRHLKRAKIAGLQYSLSKEWHQYGPWLTETDLVLCFGEYSRNLIQSQAPVVVVGNPRMEDYFANRLNEDTLQRYAQDLDPSKPTLMLAPSWQGKSLVRSLERGLKELRRDFNVFWAPHHNTRIFDSVLSNWFKRNTTAYDRYLYYLKLADILVSDTSGSLFDAIYAGKPVIIADFTADETEHGQSIEFQRRGEIGPVARSIADIKLLGRQILDGSLSYDAQNIQLSHECFAPAGQVAKRIMSAISEHLTADRH